MPTLVLMRHGETVFSTENRFAGWADTPLSAAGMTDAGRAARILGRHGLVFGLCFTSCLMRAKQSLDALRAELPLPDRIVVHDWRLNERHYGALQGETRHAMIERFGNARVVAWRRSYDACPPLLGSGDPRWREQLARFPEIPAGLHPRGESLGDAVRRVTPVWTERIAPALLEGKRVLVVAHTSSIRALARAIENLDDTESAAFRIATAVPRRYELDSELRVVTRTDLVAGLQSSVRHWANRVKPRWLGGI